MAETLGDKIKRLRKESKLTQTDLAGAEMTKSMLSQIENNLAMPSMKNLQYLAAKLGKQAAYFLDTIDEQSNQEAAKVAIRLRKVSETMREGKYLEALAELLIIPGEYNFDKESKLYADYLSKLGDCYIEQNDPKLGEAKIRDAVQIYKSKYLYIDAAKTYNCLIGIPWNSFDYAKCLEVLEEATNIYHNSFSKDSAFEIELLYNRSIFYTSLNRLEEGLKTIHEALEISEVTKIYYRADELYKMLALINSFMDNYEHYEEYMTKAKQYALFVDNKGGLSAIEGVIALKENKMGNYQKAVDLLLDALALSTDLTSPILYSELAKSYYMLGDYQQSFDTIAKIHYPDNMLNQFDFLLIWISKIYEGLCLSQFGKTDQAFEAIQQGIDRIKVLGNTKTLAFSYKSLSEIHSKNGDYEKAFILLKKANEAEEEAVSKKLYF